MRIISFASIVVSVIIAGCEPEPPPPKSGIEIKAPGVEVKVDKTGVDVKTPGTDVKADKAGVDIKSPDADVKVNP